MKFHWGTGIAIFTGLFVVMILGFVIDSFRYDSELVSEDYYEQEVAYQDRINQTANAASKQIKTAFDTQGLKLTYPEGAHGWRGTVSFFRPSDKDLDFTENIRLDEKGVQHIGHDKLTKGLWKLKFKWTEGGKEFYLEKSIVAP